ncbi:MAG TPA: nucleoside-diphosphate kinase [Paenibacillaceae bacterium]
MERTFVMVKPDGVRRGLVGEIIGRFERKGLRLVAAKFLRMSRELAERHYEEHRGRPYYEPLIEFVTSGPVMAMVWEGEQAVAAGRQLIGKTNPLEAAPGSIRGDFALNTRQNLVHASDSAESARREAANFFAEEELVSFGDGDGRPGAQG